MKLGAVFPQTEIGADPDDVARFATTAEELGYNHLIAYDHVLGANTASRPDWQGPYTSKSMFHEPFVLFAYLAGVTSTLELVTAVIILPQRQTALVAKQAACIDVISRGRLRLGIGTGWNAEEMADHGTAFDTRNKLARERIEAMKEMWTQPRAEYHGDMVEFPPMMMWPKPVQKPYPPIIVGGAWPYAARRAVRYGDGWIPHAALPPHDDVTDFIPDFQQMARDAGRDPDNFPVTIWGAQPDLDQFKQRRDRGASRVVISLESEPEDEILKQLDIWAEIMAKLN